MQALCDKLLYFLKGIKNYLIFNEKCVRMLGENEEVKGVVMHAYIKGAELPSALSLAYLGDAVYSLYIREMLIRRGCEKSGALNELSLAYVTAERQARVMRRIEPLLLEDEREVFRRAMNSKHLNRPKHASIADYRYATGFEAVLGMLHWIGDTERLNELLAHIDDDGEEKEV